MPEAVSETPQYEPILPGERSDLEAAVLGALILKDSLYDDISDLLKPEFFQHEVYAHLYKMMLREWERGRNVDMNILAPMADHDATLGPCGGRKFLQTLADNAISIRGKRIRGYVHFLWDAHLKRSLQTIGNDVLRETKLPENTGEEILSETEIQIYNLGIQGVSEKPVRSCGEIAREEVEKFRTMLETGEHVSGVTTGFRDLNALLGGFFPSDLIILAGRPGMGKTALALNMAWHAARIFNQLKARAMGDAHQGAQVLFFSLEMSKDQLVHRILSNATDIQAQKLRLGKATQKDIPRLQKACEQLESLPLYIDDLDIRTVETMRRKARRQQRIFGLDMIVVDYIQLMGGDSTSRQQGRVYEIGDITRGLKLLAKELGVPIIALSQLSRGVESREDKRPLLSDLRDSGTIEQDADVVLFIYRPSYYKRPPERREDEGDGTYTKRYRAFIEQQKHEENKAEILVAKQRHGPLGAVELFFDATHMRFADLETRHDGD